MTAPTPVDYGAAAQAAAEAHLDACMVALDAYEESGDLELLEGMPAVAPFCACTTCEVREVLAAAWPIVLRSVVDQLEAAGETRAAQLVRDEAARMDLPALPAGGVS